MHEHTQKTILLVEDEFLIAMTEKTQLEKYGYAVKTVTNGEEAIRAVDASADFDLILMDIKLGDGIDGTDTAEIILKSHDIPIVFVSSYIQPEIVEKTEKITSYGYVVKSSSVTVLDASIKMAFKLFQAKTVAQSKERQIYEHEEKYRLLHEFAGVGIGYYNIDGIILSYNQLAAKHLGGVPEDFIGKSIYDLFPKSDADVYFNRIHRAASSAISDVYEDIVPLRTGNMYFLSTYTKIADIEKNLLGIQIISQDITDRKQIEKALHIKNEEIEVMNVELRAATEELQGQNSKLIQSQELLIQSEDRLIQAEKIAKIGHWTLQLDTKTIIASSGADDIYGVDFKRMALAEVQRIVLPEYRHILDQTLADLVNKNNPYDIEFKILRPSEGNIRDIHSIATYDKRSNTVFGVIQDITDKKNTENTLSQSLDKVQLLLNSAAEGIYGVDLNDNCTFCNNSCLKLLGYEHEDELLGKNMHWQIHGKYPDGTKYPVEACRMYQAFHKGVGIHVTDEVLWRSDGSSFPCEYWSYPQEKNGKVVGAVVSFLNIADRKHTEQALRDSQERLRFALEGSNLGEWDWNLKTNELKRNERWAEMLGYTPDEINHNLQQGIELQHPGDRANTWKAVQDHLDGKTEYYSIEYRMRTKSGSYKWIRDCGKIMERDAQGNPMRLCGTHADIDEQKKLDEVILESNTLLFSILDSSPDVIVFALDTNYNYLAFNTKHKEVIKNIWGKDISIGTNMLDVIGNHDDRVKAKESFDRALAGRSFIIVEEYGDEKLSRQSWLDYWSPIKNPDGSIIGLTCFLMNNTKQKIAQDKIESLLAEKDLILKEVHHRIKNNMNTISSLLSLQADSVRDISAVLALQDAGNRVQSMSLLYDKLYRALEYNKMSMKTYLSSLVDEVVANFPNSRMVKVEKDIEDFVLDVKRLQSLGIILNELITNIMKYAFAGKACGQIAVSAISNDGRIIISVQDDGIGIPESITFVKSSGFGLQLVQMLAEQLEGTVRIERGKGTKVVLEFAL